MNTANIESEFLNIFPYDSFRESQLDGMKNVYNSIQNNGIVVMEGACGTGKTLTSLTPYLYYIKENKTDLETIAILTSVKQQMKAFEEEVRKVNSQLEDDFSGLSIVGVLDLHPFFEQGLIEYDYSRIQTLRENTRVLVNNYGESYEQLYKRVESDVNENYAYGNSIPEQNSIQYDPYYAKYRAEYDINEDNAEEVIPFDFDNVGLVDSELLTEKCAKEGLCPHSIMRLSIPFADIIIGNYTHIFDEKTVATISEPLLSEETAVIFDEAHNIVPRVRDFLSQSVTLTSITKAQEEIEELHVLYMINEMSDSQFSSFLSEVQSQDNPNSKYKELLQKTQRIINSNATVTTSVDDLIEFRGKWSKLTRKLPVEKSDIAYFEKFLSKLETVFEQKISQESLLKEDMDISLRKPSKPQNDSIKDWVILTGMNKDKIKTAESIGEYSKQIRDALVKDITDEEDDEEKRTAIKSVGKLITSWFENDNVHFYRSIKIEKRYKSSAYAKYDWQADYKAKITLHNCIPKEEIADIIDTFHSSVLMSATLQPLDLFIKTTGINELEEKGRQIIKCEYGLNFPKENRKTLGVTAEPYTSKNRGQAFINYQPNTDNETRKQYINAVTDIVQETPGNVLIAMPNYSEAEWMGAVLRDNSHVRKKVYIDESSSNIETTELLTKFFNDKNGVLVTGARGTLIEGIDYKQDKLLSAVVCGVPIINTYTNENTAIKAAYDYEFKEDGFKTAFIIPSIWKARQILGRVIRTNEDKGVRVLIDNRYINTDKNELLSKTEQEELEEVKPENVKQKVSSFWM